MITSACGAGTGTLDRIHHALYLQVPRKSRARSEPHRLHHRQPEREKCRKRGACIDPHGYDAGKLIKGKKRHVLVDTQGLLLHAIVTAADVQDRDGGLTLLASLFGLFPFLGKLFADSAYQGPILHRALADILPHLETEIVKRSDRVTGFAVPAQALDRRTLHRLAQPLSPGWPKIGKTSTAHALGFLKARFHPPHASKTL